MCPTVNLCKQNLEPTASNFSSGISSFVQIFPAINNRALIPLPSAIGRRDGDAVPYLNTTGTSGACSTLTLSFMKKNLRLLLAGLVMTFLTLLANVTYSQNVYLDAGLPQPTVTSDKDDYAPGEIAHITGSGWTLDQQVHVVFKEEPDYPDFHIYHSRIVTHRYRKYQPHQDFAS